MTFRFLLLVVISNILEIQCWEVGGWKEEECSRSNKGGVSRLLILFVWPKVKKTGTS